MEITQNFVNLWWWLQGLSEENLLSGLAIGVSVLISAYATAFYIQHRKRLKYDNLDLTNKVKRAILWSLLRVSSVFALADYVVLVNALHMDVQLSQYFFGAWGSIVALTTVLHRVHVSKAYTKLSRVLTSFTEDVKALRAVKKEAKINPTLPPLSEVTSKPADQPASFEG
jgi:hypothetical protein